MEPLANAKLLTLLEQSLLTWRVLGKARLGDDGAIVISRLGADISVTRAPQGQPFRWMVAIDGRRRPALSLVAVLRQVRAALDPDFKPVRIRIAGMPGTAP